MKLSKMLFSVSILIGFIGIGTLFLAIVAGLNNLVFGLTREHLLFCSIIVFIIAIWTQIIAIYHVMVEESKNDI